MPEQLAVVEVLEGLEALGLAVAVDLEDVLHSQLVLAVGGGMRVEHVFLQGEGEGG